MDWQTTIAAAIVIVTLAIFVARLVFTKNNSGCGHGCGCGKPDEVSPPVSAHPTLRSVETHATTPPSDDSPSALGLK